MVGRSSSAATRPARREWLAFALLGAGVGGGCAGASQGRAAQGPPTTTAGDGPARAVGTVADAATPRPAAFRGTIAIAGRAAGPSFRVEIARSEAERARGLMFRSRLDADAGMLFCMGSDADWTFWMHDTYLSLDMIFIDADWRVVGVLAAVPPQNDIGRKVGKRSRYVLELAAHQARVHGIVPGTKLIFVEATGAAHAGEGAAHAGEGAER